MNVHLSEVAEVPMEQAFDFYEDVRDGLGVEFAHELERAFRVLAEAPRRWAEVEGNFRRYRLRRFPYSLYYRVKSKGVDVLAIWHDARKPHGWRDDAS